MNFRGLTFRTQLAFFIAVSLPLTLLLTLGVDHYQLKERNLYRKKTNQHKLAALKLDKIYQSYLTKLRSLVLDFYHKAPLAFLEGSYNSQLWVNSSRGTFGRLQTSSNNLNKFRMAYSKIYLAHRKIISAALYPKNEIFDDFKSPVRLQIYAIENSYTDPNYSNRNYQPSATEFPSQTLKETLRKGIPEFQDEYELKEALEKLGHYQWYAAPRNHPIIYSSNTIVNEIWDEMAPAFWPVFRVLVFGRKVGKGITGVGSEIFSRNIVDLRGRFIPLRFLDRSLELYWNTVPPNFDLEKFEDWSAELELKSPQGILVALVDSKAAQDHFLSLITKKPDLPYFREIILALDEWSKQLVNNGISWKLTTSQNEPEQTSEGFGSVLTTIVTPSFKSDASHAMQSMTGPIQSELRNLLLSMIFTAIIVLALTTYLAYLLSDRIVDPVLSINALASLIKAGKLGLKIDSNFNLELAMLAREFQKAAWRIQSRIDALNFLKDIHTELIRTDSKRVMPVILKGLVSRLDGNWGCIAIFDSVVSRKIQDYDFYGSHENQIAKLFGEFEIICQKSRNGIHIEFIKMMDPGFPSGLLCFAPRPSHDAGQKNILLFIAGALRDEDKSFLSGLMSQIQTIASRQLLEDVRLDSQKAREIHINSIDIERPPADSGIDLDFYVSTGGGPGNCFVTWVKIRDNRWRFIVGECKIHGIRGALAAAMLRARIRGSNSSEDLGQILISINSMLIELDFEQSDISFVICEIDFESSEVYFFQGDGSFFHYEEAIMNKFPISATRKTENSSLTHQLIQSVSLDKCTYFSLGTMGLFQHINDQQSGYDIESFKSFEKSHSHLKSQIWIRKLLQEIKNSQDGYGDSKDHAVLRVRLNR